MIYFAPPPPWGHEGPPAAGTQGANALPGGLLSGRRHGLVPARLPLRPAEAFLVGDDAGGPAGALVRFSVLPSRRAGRLRRSALLSRSRGTSLASLLAGSAGELRLVRGRGVETCGARRGLTVLLTLNGITDAADLAGMNVTGPLPSIAGSAPRRVAAFGLDVRFTAGAWGLAGGAGRMRCRIRLEGLAQLRSDWPAPW